MLVVLETTKWDCGFPVPNHIYALNKSRDELFGYVKFGSDDWQWFPEPRGFEAKGRKFVVIEERPDPVQEEVGEVWKIPSSTKGEWTVRRVNGEFSCDCPSHKYQRKECKHIQQIRKSLQ